MSIFRKLNTLLSAGARESAERITEANAIRIYRQEIVDAENLLERRRGYLAGLIATRKDLEREISSSRKRIGNREQQVAALAPQERSEQLLLLAAKDIAATEAHLAKLNQRHLQIVERINTEELTLRKLLTQIKEHRREVRILAAEHARNIHASAGNYQDTVAGHLATLRETRASISGNMEDANTAEASAEEVVTRLDSDPLDRELAAQGKDAASVQLATVLERLRGLGCPA